MDARLRIGAAFIALSAAAFVYREIGIIATVPFVLGSLQLLRKGDSRRVFALLASSGSSAPPPSNPDHQRTRFLDVYADGASLRGRFRAGKFTGRSLALLSLPELVDALGEIEAEQDQDSSELLRLYLDEQHPDWLAADTADTEAGPDMDLTAALQQLGLEADASVEEIKQRFADLAKVFHADKGGNDAAMRRLTQARNLALAAAARRT